MKTGTEHLEEFKTPSELVDAAITAGIIKTEKRQEIINFIDQVQESGKYDQPTDWRYTEAGDLYVPLTLRSLKGFINHYEKTLEERRKAFETADRLNYSLTNEEINRFGAKYPRNKKLKETEEPAEENYKGIAVALKKYIEGATDQTITYIHKYKRLPDNTARPKWKDSKAEASRFMTWCGMKEAGLKKCFEGVEDIAPYNRPEITELNGSIYDILTKYAPVQQKK